MKTLIRLIIFGGLMTVGITTRAQEAKEVEQLKQQLQQVQNNFERVQKEQQEEIKAMQQHLDALRNTDAATPAPDSLCEHDHGQAEVELDHLHVPEEDYGAHMDFELVGTIAFGSSTASDVEELQLGGHDPNRRGFTFQGLEASVTGSVEPFRAHAKVLFGLDAENDPYVDLEEAWAETVCLPGHLQFRAGQFLTDFGRINTQHAHDWAFVDSPLVNARLLGADGLRNPGARFSWLMPVPFYSECFLAVQESKGETAAGFRSEGHHSHGGGDEDELPFGYRHSDNDRGVHAVDDLLLAPRWASAFELTDEQELTIGFSAAFGPNASGNAGNTRTEIYGADLAWNWQPHRHHGHDHANFPFVTWQSEVMLRKYDLGAFDWAGEPSDELQVLESDGVTPAVLGRETISDWGGYSQVLWGFKPDWVAGLRFDYVAGHRAGYESAGLIAQSPDGSQEALGRDPLRNSRWRLSPNLTWYPSEFSRIRMQYNYDHRQSIGVDHSLWVQLEFVLGNHASHGH